MKRIRKPKGYDKEKKTWESGVGGWCDIYQKLPKGYKHIISKDIQGNALGFVGVKYLGNTYFIPITDGLRSFLKDFIRVKNGKLEIEHYFLRMLEHWFCDIYGSLYLQIRETVGAEIESTLTQQMTERFEEMFQPHVEKAIDDKFDEHEKKLLKEHKDEQIK